MNHSPVHDESSSRGGVSPLIIAAVQRSIAGDKAVADGSATVQNKLPLPILVNGFDGSRQINKKSIPGRGSATVVVNRGGTSQIQVTLEATGGIVTVVELQDKATLTIDYASLQQPNHLGPVPVPRPPDCMVPEDGPLVVVGMNVTKDANHVLIREQYWARQGDSYSVAPGEELTTSYTRTIGVTNSSTDISTFSAALGMSVSGGWGPVSASVNASLNQASTTIQQTTLSEQQTSFESRVIRNTTDKPVTYLKWQLIDVITLFGAKSRLCLNVEQDPIVTAGPY